MDALSLHHCEQVLNTALLSLESSKSTKEHLQSELSSLSQLIKQTLQSEQFRDELSRSERVWRLVRVLLEVEVPVDPETLSLRVRLLRGVLMFARNLLSMHREVAGKVHIKEAVFTLLTRVEGYNIDTQIKSNVVVSGFELLANLSVNQKSHGVKELDEVVAMFDSAQVWTKEALHPTFAYIDSLFNDSDLLYECLSKGKGKPILSILLQEYEKVDLTHELDTYSTLIITMFTKLVFHESFLKFITLHNTPEDMVRYLKVAQAIVTSKQDWGLFELTVVLSWNLELFQKTLVEIQEHFTQKSRDEPVVVYSKISSVMDIFSTLSHFEHARKFMVSYKCVELFVSLLGLLHTNVKPQSKLKDQMKQDDKIRHPRDFPHIKSMIIETLTSLVHDNFEVQEQVREIHGLELVLSNCIIDENEPFIKERAIVCLRFLLKDNVKNQEFVAQMEAKEVVPNETLDEVGFEVEIVDGKVQMKRKPKVEELPGSTN